MMRPMLPMPPRATLMFGRIAEVRGTGSSTRRARIAARSDRGTGSSTRPARIAAWNDR
jgi:hypothetical protein